MLQTMQWTGHSLRLLDQTKLPTKTEYLDITDEKQMWDAIRRLVVRGAPAIGVAAAFGVYLGVRDCPDDPDELRRRLDEVCKYPASSRPTAVNLFWAVDRVKRVAEVGPKYRATPDQLCRIIKQRILDEALAMLDEDARVCRTIGEHGLALLQRLPTAGGETRLLTHCNAGSL